MSKEDAVEAHGVVEEAMPNAQFRVKLDDANLMVLATISGKMRKNNIRVLPGDKVQLELSQYDLTRGRIVYRFK